MYRIETAASDHGVPCAATAAVVAALASICLRVESARRLEVLGLLEQLTGGRGIELYDESQQRWYVESALELAFSMAYWVHLMESGSAEEQTACFGLVSNCGNVLSHQRPRLASYLSFVAERCANLAEELPVALSHWKTVDALLTH